MKLSDIHTLLEDKYRSENDNLHETPPPGDTGEYITTAQAAVLIGVTQARVRQFIMEKRLKTYKPTKGRRDNMLKLAEVKEFAKKEREITGRPPEDTKKSDKDD